MSTIHMRLWAASEATIGVMIDTTQVDLRPDSTAEIQLAVDEETVLSWVVAGSPGALYEIQLNPLVPGYKLHTTSGSHPVKGRISTQLYRGAGHIRFVLRRESRS